MKAVKLSVCLLTEGKASGLLEFLMDSLVEQLGKIQGELVLVGDLTGVRVPKEVLTQHLPEEARERRRGLLRNRAIESAHGRLILSGDSTALLAPWNWPRRLLEWVQPIPEHVPILFGFKIVSHLGERLWDWVRVDRENKVSNVDYGEQIDGLAIGAGSLGMSRAAWEASGGFNEEFVGPCEEIEFTRRCLKDRRIPLVFCDALWAVRVYEPEAVQRTAGQSQAAGGRMA